MKKITTLLFVVFSIQFGLGQVDSSYYDLSFEERFEKYDVWHIHFSAQTSVWVPLGKLKETFEPSPSLGLRLGFLITPTFRTEVALNITLPVATSSFDFNTGSTILDAKSDGAHLASHLLLTHETNLGKDFYLGKQIGIGFAFISTNQRKPECPCDDDESDFYDMTTFYLSPGITLNKRMKYGRAIGLAISYNFTPYAFTRRVDGDFGNSAFTVGLNFSL